MLITAPIVLSLILTSYRSVPNQTDMSPHITSTGEYVHARGVAMSQDLLCPLAKGRVKTHPRSKCLYQTHIHYGDRVLVEGYGYKYVNDAMNQRHRNRIDLWVATYDEEKAVGVQKNRSVYVF